MPPISRRDFIKFATTGFLTASGLLGLGGLWRFMGHQDSPPHPVIFDLGLAEQFPLGSRTVLGDVPAVLVHAQGGFYAISLACTHLGCTVSATQGGFTCPCHESEYAVDGKVLKGPASENLKLFLVEKDERGHLILRRDMIIASPALLPE